MTNVFAIDVHHFSVFYEVSKNHTAVNCPGGGGVTAPGRPRGGKNEWIGVTHDKRRSKWKAAIRVGGKEKILVSSERPFLARFTAPW